MLREGHQPLVRGRAGHLPHHADVRHGPRERRPRPGHAQGEVRGSIDHGKHARVVSAALHPQPRAVWPRRPSEEHHLPHGGCLRRAAPGGEAFARPGDVLLPVRLYRQGRRHGARRHGAAGDLLLLLRGRLPRVAPNQVCRDARSPHRRTRMQCVAGEHGVERRRVWCGQAHEAGPHARHGPRRARWQARWYRHAHRSGVRPGDSAIDTGRAGRCAGSARHVGRRRGV